MASSSFNNSHWPSLFRSKHAVEPWQTQPDIGSSPPSLLPAGGSSTGRCLKHPLSGYAGGEERTPDPKPRWNPRPEQIRILEAIFNSGMINPPRDEIPRIRMRLQEYGQVGDANVFYWFQNRKARSKNKLRNTAAAGTGRLGLGLARAPMSRAAAAAAPVAPAPPPPQQQQPLIQSQFQLLASPVQAPTSSSSSSSDRSSGSSKPAAKPVMSATAAAMDLLGPLAAACPHQVYYQGHPVAPVSAPAHKVLDLVVASDEPVFQPLPQGCCFSASEVAAILGAGGQYMHVPVQQQQPPAAFLGLCNEVTEPTVTGHRTCSWSPAAGLGQFWLESGAHHHHHQLGLGKNNTIAATNTVAREVVAHEDATKLGLLQYGFGASTAMEAAPTAAPLAVSPGAAVTVASVAAATTSAGLSGLPASTNGVVSNYDHLLQGLAVAAGPGAGAVAGVSTSGAPPAAIAAAAPTPVAHQEGVAALCITDTVTGKSVAHNVAATRLDVRAHFGEGAVVLRGVGDGERGLDVEPVPVDASGCTVEPLQHGAFYYVLV